MKTITICVRVSQEEHERIKEASEIDCRSISSLIKKGSLLYSRKILNETPELAILGDKNETF